MNDILGKEQIRKLRVKLRLTQQEFADKLGVSLMTISRWELGLFSPSMKNIRKIEELAKGENE